MGHGTTLERQREGDRDRKPGAHALVEPIAHMWGAREPVGDSKLGGIEGGEQVGCGEQVERREERRVDDGEGDRLRGRVRVGLRVRVRGRGRVGVGVRVRFRVAALKSLA